MARLSAPARFRAKAWQCLAARPDVWALSPCAFKLLAGIVWKQLNEWNNGNLILGPSMLSECGFRGRAHARHAIEELTNRKLLYQTTQARRGAATYYAVYSLPIEHYPEPMFAAERQALRAAPNLSNGGQVELSAGGHRPPEDLSAGGHALSAGGQDEAPGIKGSRARAHARSERE